MKPCPEAVKMPDAMRDAVSTRAQEWARVPVNEHGSVVPLLPGLQVSGIQKERNPGEQQGGTCRLRDYNPFAKPQVAVHVWPPTEKCSSPRVVVVIAHHSPRAVARVHHWLKEVRCSGNQRNGTGEQEIRVAAKSVRHRNWSSRGQDCAGDRILSKINVH